MKRTLAFVLFLATAAAAVAQTPTVVEKRVAKAGAKTKAAPQAVVVPAKPAPSAVKVVSVPSPKAGSAPQASGKPVVATATTTKAVPQAHPVPAANVKAPTAPAKTTSVAAGTTKSTPGVTKPGVPAKSEVKAASAQPKQSTRDPFAGKKKQGPAVASKAPSKERASTVAEAKAPAESKPVKKIGAAGRRDPFISPVVSMTANGSGCNSGKRCLAIDQIALKGVVRADVGMIAVVVNAMDKAYFLRENDPVFNGYVVKITPNSIVFKETFRDKLGKPLTRDVTKTISKPVA